MDALSLGEGEALCYCVPADLGFDNRKMQAREAYGGQTWLAVTDRRFVVLKEEGAVASFFLEDCEKIKCEHQVHSGIVTVTKKDGQMICAARFSMRHIVRVAYAVRGAQALITAREKGTKPEQVVSMEYEKYCEKCGRALPGHLEGSVDLRWGYFLHDAGQYFPGSMPLLALCVPGYFP